MDKVMEASSQVYDFCSVRVGNFLEGLDEGAVEKRIGDQANPMIWIAGHITVSRCNLARALGRPVDHGWGDRFDRGAEVDDPRLFLPLTRRRRSGRRQPRSSRGVLKS